MKKERREFFRMKTFQKANGNCCGAGVFMPQVKMK
nr:hypothetical protein BSM_20970 [uncultured archaeon]